MKREERYLVIKLTDLKEAKKRITAEEFETFKHVCDMVSATRTLGLKKPPLNCVVVESDWPEYESTWQAIERRVDYLADESRAASEKNRSVSEVAKALDKFSLPKDQIFDHKTK